jgi:hypothetical protein
MTHKNITGGVSKIVVIWHYNTVYYYDTLTLKKEVADSFEPPAKLLSELTPCIRVILRKLLVAQLIEICFQYFMKPKS